MSAHLLSSVLAPRSALVSVSRCPSVVTAGWLPAAQHSVCSQSCRLSCWPCWTCDNCHQPCCWPLCLCKEQYHVSARGWSTAWIGVSLVQWIGWINAIEMPTKVLMIVFYNITLLQEPGVWRRVWRGRQGPPLHRTAGLRFRFRAGH